MDMIADQDQFKSNSELISVNKVQPLVDKKTGKNSLNEGNDNENEAVPLVNVQEYYDDAIAGQVDSSKFATQQSKPPSQISKGGSSTMGIMTPSTNQAQMQNDEGRKSAITDNDFSKRSDTV